MSTSTHHALQKKSTSKSVPEFSLYGEPSKVGEELLHIEDIQSRSRLYRWEIAPHQHHGLFQVLWVRKGRVKLVLDDRQDELDGPIAIVVPPHVVHGFQFEHETDGLVLTLGLRFLVEGDFQAVGEAFRKVFAAPGVLRYDSEAESAVATRLDALFSELAAQFKLPRSEESPVIGWLARSVIWWLAQSRTEETTQASNPKVHRQQAHFTRFLLLIEQHFLEHWSIERYADRLGLSVPRLNRLVQAEGAESALELVHERLTREACRRLLYVAAPAANIALDLGFEDPAYFSRFFKRRAGMSPHRYRVMHRDAEEV